jgi:hypothetical protein
MGRPRKRRRDEASVPIEPTRVNVSEPISDSVASPTFGDYGMITPQLNDFSGFSDFEGHDGLDSHISVLHDDSNLANAYGNGNTSLEE